MLLGTICGASGWYILQLGGLGWFPRQAASMLHSLATAIKPMTTCGLDEIVIAVLRTQQTENLNGSCVGCIAG